MLSNIQRTFRDWSQSRPLKTSLSRAEAAVRAHPRNLRSRRLLFDLLCVLGQWERALIQLRILAGNDRGLQDSAKLLHELIRAEQHRHRIFCGLATPISLGGARGVAHTWMLQLSEAIRLVAQTGDPAAGGSAAVLRASDELRRSALARAPETGGRCNVLPDAFGWVTDTDTRLGPVCEMVVPEGYCWVAMDDLRSLHKDAPAQLLDLVWSRVSLELRQGGVVSGYMPMRYPVRPGDRDTLLLARETAWSNLGETAVLGHGQKVWSTDRGDISLLDLRHCSFQAGADST